MRKASYSQLPDYLLSDFIAVRHSVDNLINVLKAIDIINNFSHYQNKDASNNFDIALFMGNCKRLVIKKKDGYFSMSVPFSIVFQEQAIYFTFDFLQERVDGKLISMLKSILLRIKDGAYSFDELVLTLVEMFDISFDKAVNITNGVYFLLSEDHGYFRFDHDPDNEDGEIHPTFHFDFFFRNHTKLKIGSETNIAASFFDGLFDHTKKCVYFKPYET